MDFLESATTASGPLVEWAIEFTPKLISALIIMIVGWMAAAWARRAVRTALLRSKRLDRTIHNVLASTVRYAILIIVLVAALGQLGVSTTSLLAALGAAGLAIGLALQGTLSNIAAGIMLLWLRPFRIGDYVETSDVAGTVREIGLFATELDTYDGIYRFVPNSEIWNTPITNYSRNPSRMTNLVIGISYGSDINKARDLLLELARECEPVADDPAPIAFVASLDDSAVTLNYRVWIANADYWATMRYLLEESKRRLDAAGIEIPFPQRVIHIVNDEAPDTESGTEAVASGPAKMESPDDPNAMVDDDR